MTCYKSLHSFSLSKKLWHIVWKRLKMSHPIFVEDRAKREPSLCNESVNGHFWSNLCLNCIFKWTWFVKTDIWSVIDRSRVQFPVEAPLIFFLFSPFFPLFWLDSSSVPLEFPKFQLWIPTYFILGATLIISSSSYPGFPPLCSTNSGSRVGKNQSSFRGGKNKYETWSTSEWVVLDFQLSL